jgi:histidinol-phosphate aminotransferase
MNSYGLSEWIRVSIGTAEQNARFLKELRELPNLARLATA